MLSHAEVLCWCGKWPVPLPPVAAQHSQLIRLMPCPAEMLNQAEVALTAPLPHVYAATERGDNTLPLPEVGAWHSTTLAHFAPYIVLASTQLACACVGCNGSSSSLAWV